MTEASATPPAASGGWWNRTVIGAGLTSFLADVSYEAVLSVLPHFLVILQIPIAFLGIMEGAADALASFVKLGAGWYSDRIGRRKPLVIFGYAVTVAMSLFIAVAVSWPVILLGRLVAWFGKGVRGPLRNALLADAVSKADRGKAFGLHRAGDTLGAIAGPLLAGWFLAQVPGSLFTDPTYNYRLLFLLTVIPGLLSAIVFAVTVPERIRREPPQRKLWTSIRELPRSFRRWLIGVGLFGAGDFSHVLLIVAAGQLLAPEYGVQRAAVFATWLYAARNAAHVVAALIIGAVSDRWGRHVLLAFGYLIGVVTTLGFALAFYAGTNLFFVAVLFLLAGAYLAIEETLEPALTADLVADSTLRGTAFGILGVVNGFGDLISSAVVGALWLIKPEYGFTFAAVAMALGTAVLLSQKGQKSEVRSQSSDSAS